MWGIFLTSYGNISFLSTAFRGSDEDNFEIVAGTNQNVHRRDVTVS
jgi:hypothetical protein